MIADRVTLPLAALRIAADRLCNVICIDPWTDEVLAGGHDVACLQPLLVERDLKIADAYDLIAASSKACLAGKHERCEMCACYHHTPKGERPYFRSARG